MKYDTDGTFISLRIQGRIYSYKSKCTFCFFSKDYQTYIFKTIERKKRKEKTQTTHSKFLSKFSIFPSLSTPKSSSMLDHGSFGFWSLLNRLKWNDLVTVSYQCKLTQVKGDELIHHSPGASICPCCTMLIALMIIVGFTLMFLKANAVERTVKLDLSKDRSWSSHWRNENEDENKCFFFLNTVWYFEIKICALKILQNFLLVLRVWILSEMNTSCEVSHSGNLQKYSCF